MLVYKKILAVCLLVFLILTRPTSGKHLDSSSINLPSTPGPTIYIYKGPGTSPLAVKQVECSLQNIVDPEYLIKLIGPEEVKKGEWHKDAVLFLCRGALISPIANTLLRKGMHK